MMPPKLSIPAPAIVGGERRSSAEGWTGEKRSRTGGSPSPLDLLSSSSDDSTDALMCIRSLVQEEQEGHGPTQDFVFSAEDDIDYDELSRCRKELKSRQILLHVDCARTIRGKAKDDLYEHLCGLRFAEYKVLNNLGPDLVDDTTQCRAVWDFEDPFEPGPSMFGWTIDPEYFDLAELNDYQRIVPVGAKIYEYHDWEKYRITFTKYETDVDYVKYCDELSKKIKWVEKYLTSEYIQDSTYKDRGARQALKIATGFSHLPLYLATRGYVEYVHDVCYSHESKDYVSAYFEVWKRMFKQEMSFEDAVNQTFLENTFHYPNNAKAGLEGCGLVYFNFDKCMAQIGQTKYCMEQCPVLKDSEALERIADMIYGNFERPKMYVDYVKKKMEVAKRIGLISDVGDGEL